MKKIIAAAAIAGLAGLSGCSVSAPAPDAASASSVPEPSPASPSSLSAGSGASGVPGGAGAGSAKAACELFNSLYVDLRAAGDDATAFKAVFRKAWDAKDTVSGNLKGLFTSVGALALDHASEVQTGSPIDQATRDAVRDAVFANAGECTAEGVTLRQ